MASEAGPPLPPSAVLLRAAEVLPEICLCRSPTPVLTVGFAAKGFGNYLHGVVAPV
eukprot:CAMPEP_0117661180 /NCGR_PEP_ID=MMETSP0804-20121206/7403_1 /TAXON_ID=1074897 /ORGANISM="Tetraselmis astigmatica, Strain CCMP880" /LENGTH=55 /DNA_ID=CAMNT_0005468037 /DNA_START=188 /DNA_END=355 /DNA_ORIENTATION=+